MMILNTTNQAGQLKGKFGILQRQRLAWPGWRSGRPLSPSSRAMARMLTSSAVAT